MDFEKTYQDIIQNVKAGGRGQIKLSSSDYDFLKQKLSSKLDLTKCLRLLSCDTGFNQNLTSELLAILDNGPDTEEIILCLMCLKHHHINGRARLGERVDSKVLEALDRLLSHENAEVVEWVLRVIDDMGSQSLYFAKKVKALKPGRMAMLLNHHKRNTFEIINLLESKWGKYDRSL